MKWTDEQLLAIKKRGSTLLVSAAAGSGKTAVLVERIIRQISEGENPASIENFLVLTYTNAAAREMKRKIAKRLQNELKENPENSHLRLQAKLIAGAKICTVHAFCADLLRQNFSLLSLPADFRIEGGHEVEVLKDEAVRHVLDEAYEGDEDGFLRLLTMFSSEKGDYMVQKLLLDLYEKMTSFEEPQKKLEEFLSRFNIKKDGKIKDTAAGQVIFRAAYEKVSFLKELCEKQTQMLERAVPEVSDGYLPVFQNDLEFIAALLEMLKKEEFNEIVSFFKAFEFQTMRTKKGFSDHPDALTAKEVRGFVKSVLGELKEDIFYMDEELFLEDIESLQPVMSALCRLINELSDEIKREKAARGILDFSDLEHEALRLLKSRESAGIVSELKKKYRYLYVDEYQDTSEIQDAIFKRLEDEQGLFMVGDIKQSIYRFRRAKPELFLEKYRSFSKAGSGEKQEKIMLTRNFRSRGEVLSFANFLFKRLMSSGLGEIEYGEDESLRPGAEYPEAENDKFLPELHIVETGDASGEEAVALEASVVGQRILELVDSKFPVFDNAILRERPAKFSDIVIFLRSDSAKGQLYGKALGRLGIPTHKKAKGSFFEHMEVLTMLSFLRVIDNPYDDISLISLLRSPIFAFSEDLLLKIRKSRDEGSFYDALMDFSCEALVEDFLKKLEKYRQKAQDLPLYRLIWYLYETSGFYEMLSLMPNSEARKENLKILFEYARMFDKTTYRDLYQFLSFIERMIGEGGELGVQGLSPESGDAVRIMSIHKSKGLEFPICFLSETGSAFNYMDLNASVLLQSEIGFGPSFKDDNRGIKYPTIFREGAKILMRSELLSEEMRVFYVALTRAKEKLIITGRLGDFEKTSEAIKNLLSGISGEVIPAELLKQSPSYLRWILGGLYFSNDNLSCSSECRVKIHNGDKAVELKMPEKEAGAREEEKEPEDYEEVTKRLILDKNRPPLEVTPVKYSVTELKGRLLDFEIHDEEERKPGGLLFDPPKFMQEKRITPQERGTALHLAMQYLDFNNARSEADIIRQLETMVKREMLTQKEMEAADARLLHGFFRSELGQRALLAERIYREKRFNLMIKKGELFLNREAPEDMMIQGVIDCFFVEKNKNVVLIDYKSDKLTKKDRKELEDRYALQMEVYSRAILEIFGFKTFERYIFLLGSGESVALN